MWDVNLSLSRTSAFPGARHQRSPSSKLTSITLVLTIFLDTRLTYCYNV
jgi:hypothetical protein